MGRPWSELDSFNVVVTGRISKTSEVTERCVHTLAKPEDKDHLMTLQFDWQRSFETGWQITKANLERIVNDAKKNALDYFEDIAEGNRFDEVLISGTTEV